MGGSFPSSKLEARMSEYSFCHVRDISLRVSEVDAMGLLILSTVDDNEEEELGRKWQD